MNMLYKKPKMLTLCLFCEKHIPNSICELNYIENLNWLQIVYSERFIFSHKNEFELVKKQLKTPYNKVNN